MMKHLHQGVPDPGGLSQVELGGDELITINNVIEREKSVEAMEAVIHCDEKTCRKGCEDVKELLAEIYKAPSNAEKQEKRCNLKVHMEQSGISLSDQMCDKKKTKVSVVSAILQEPNGHQTLKHILDSLITTNEEEVKITLSSNLINKAGRETVVLEALLQLRDKCIKRRNTAGTEAVRGLLRHPVMEALVREKWLRVRFLSFCHIGFWLLFTVALSCYLRLEINTQLIRRNFYNETATDYSVHWDYCCVEVLSSDKSKQDEATPNHESKCMKLKAIENITDRELITKLKDSENRTEASKHLEAFQLKICHPNIDDFFSDSSRLVFLTLVAIAAVGWITCLVLLIRTYLSSYESEEEEKEIDEKEKARNERNKQKKVVKKAVTLFTITVGFIVIAIAAWSDSQHLKPNPATPFWNFDDGFNFIGLTVCLLGVYFIAEFLDEVVILRPWHSGWRTNILDPVVWFQLVTAISGLVSVAGKLYLTDGDYGLCVGLPAIGITLAWLNLILKIGRYSHSVLGNFATMFHILLKKLRYYMLAIFILLFGFSFGFWVINQHEPNEKRAFQDFANSMKNSFVMFFGEFGEFSTAVDYTHEVMKKHYVTLIAFYILFLMMIIMSSLAMLNLLLAAIITDYRKNVQEVHTQNLISMAQYAVVVERGLISGWLGLISKRMDGRAMVRLEASLEAYTYCARELCLEPGGRPGHLHLEEEFRGILLAARRTPQAACTGCLNKGSSVDSAI